MRERHIPDLLATGYFAAAFFANLSESQKDQHYWKIAIRMLNIAKCYRRQSDVSHNPFFYH